MTLFKQFNYSAHSELMICIESGPCRHYYGIIFKTTHTKKE